MHPLEPALVDLPGREPPQRLGQPDRAFEARQRGPDAEVRAVTEREVPVDHPPHVEAVGILEVALVAVTGTVEQREREPRGMTVPCSSTSRETQRDWIGDGAS